MRPVYVGFVCIGLLLGYGRAFSQETAGVQVVRKVPFQGNRAIDEKTLRAALSTQQASLPYRLSLTRWIGLAPATLFDPPEVRRHVPRVQAPYGEHGFPARKVDTP